MRNFGPKLKPVKDMAVGGNKWARARVISKAIDKGTPSVEPLPNNVGWGPRQSIHVVHDTDAPTKLTLYSPERWDAIHEGAPEVGIKVNLAIQEQQLIILYQVRQRRQLKLERDLPRDLTE